MFFGHLESALEWTQSKLSLEYQPPVTAAEGVWKIQLCGPWIPPALDKPLIDVQAFAALHRLDAAISSSPLRLNPNHLLSFDNELLINETLDSLFVELIGKVVPNTQIIIDVETVRKIFVVTINARDFSYGNAVIPRTDAGMRLHVALERAMMWYVPEVSVAKNVAA